MTRSVYRSYGDTTSLALEVGPQGLCRLTIETEEDYTSVEGIEVDVLIELLQALGFEEPDEFEFE